MSITGTLIVQMIVFLILVWFTMKFVWPPITAALDERARKVADGLAAADKARTELASANKRIEAELSQARAETTQRIADADKRAQAIVEEAKKRAEEGGNQVVSVRFQGQVREEAGAAPVDFNEVWHLVKPADDSRSWAIAGIEQSH